MRDNLLLKAKETFKVSKPAFFLLLGALLLCIILAVATVNNINRGLQLMKLSFLRQGSSMIHSFEAGTRTSMLFSHHIGQNPLVDLAAEILKDDGVAYIRIFDEQNNEMVSLGVIPQSMEKTTTDIEAIGDKPISTISWQDNIFDVTKQFLPVQPSATISPLMEQHWKQWNLDYNPQGRMFISVGFFTDEFETARRSDIYHTIFMLIMLILLFCAGLYFLYLYQKMWNIHATLLNTRLYAENVFKSIPDGLITMAPDNTINSCNKNAETLLSKSMEEITNRPILEIFPLCPPEILSSENGFLEFDAECPHGNHEVIPVKIGSARIIDHLGNRIGRVLVLRDIREIRKIEIQLERSRRLAALGSMAAGIAHEVRNPLGTLRGFAQFFGSEAGASAACKKYAGFMISEVDRLNHLVSELLQFGSPRELNLSRVNIDKLQEKISTLLEKDFLNNDLTFSYHKEKDTVLYGDSDLLLQVILNLLKNSISATPAGGKISLEFSQSDLDGRIHIKDSGKGMAEEVQNKMFDPFFTNKNDGTGLGLTICHRIIEQHQGYFEVTSRTGVGTSVIIVLPREEEDYGTETGRKTSDITG